MAPGIRQRKIRAHPLVPFVFALTDHARLAVGQGVDVARHALHLLERGDGDGVIARAPGGLEFGLGGQSLAEGGGGLGLAHRLEASDLDPLVEEDLLGGELLAVVW